MIFTAHLLCWRLWACPHTCVHWLAVLWYHLLVVASTLFFYYNVLKSAGSSSARRWTSIIFRLVVHNRECCTIITISILSWIHLSVFTKSKTARYGCRDVFGSWITFKCDLRLTIAFRVLLKLSLTWFDNRNIVHEHASHLEYACIFSLSWFLYVHLRHQRPRVTIWFICIVWIHGIVLGVLLLFPSHTLLISIWLWLHYRSVEVKGFLQFYWMNDAS